MSRAGPICRVSRPDCADQRLPTTTKADAEVDADADADADAEAEAEEASAGRGGIPSPTGNLAESRGPATGAFDLRRGCKKPSGRDRKKPSDPDRA